MDPDLIKSINKKVSKKFPEMLGVKPKVHKRPFSEAKSSQQNTRFEEKLTFLITYRNTVKSSNGNKIPRWVRVVVDQNGKIIKITTSK
ncbi:MAG: hypothetical protein PVG14_14840 [Anaerolineales bacterium]|jgi:hypothetical protein